MPLFVRAANRPSDFENLRMNGKWYWKAGRNVYGQLSLFIHFQRFLLNLFDQFNIFLAFISIKLAMLSSGRCPIVEWWKVVENWMNNWQVSLEFHLFIRMSLIWNQLIKIQDYAVLDFDRLNFWGNPWITPWRHRNDGVYFSIFLFRSQTKHSIWMELAL